MKLIRISVTLRNKQGVAALPFHAVTRAEAERIARAALASGKAHTAEITKLFMQDEWQRN